MTRRANGEGSIYRRSDGRWAAAFYVLRPDGGRVRRPVYGKSRREVAAKLADLVAKTAAGVPLAVDAWTVERYGAHWLEHIAGPRLKPATVSSYRATLRLHIVPTLGRVRLRTLTPSQVRELLLGEAGIGSG